MKRLLLVPYLITSLVVCTRYVTEQTLPPPQEPILFAWWYGITIMGLVGGLVAREW